MASDDAALGISEFARLMVHRLLPRGRPDEALDQIRFWNLPLTGSDCEENRGIARAFAHAGPDLRPALRRRAPQPASRFLKPLPRGNRILPLVGDFAAPSDLRRTGDELRCRNLPLRCFHVSHAAVHPLRSERWRRWVENPSGLSCESRAPTPGALQGAPWERRRLRESDFGPPPAGKIRSRAVNEISEPAHARRCTIRWFCHGQRTETCRFLRDSA